MTDGPIFKSIEVFAKTVFLWQVERQSIDCRLAGREGLVDFIANRHGKPDTSGRPVKLLLSFTSSFTRGFSPI